MSDAANHEPARESKVRMGLFGGTVMSNSACLVRDQTLERHRLRGSWHVSPLWEGKILLGVLKQQGLAGKVLVEAFERWAPRVIGVSRSDMNSVYSKQTGREMSDYILLQQADKAVRYKQLPPESEGFRVALANLRGFQGPEGETSATGGPSLSAEHDGTAVSSRKVMIERVSGLLWSRPDARAAHSNGLLSTNELADLTGFAPKTIRRWASRRLLNFIRVGNQFRFRPAAVELFLMQREVRK